MLIPLQLCHINGQWAQDYESLTQKMTANSTGYYSTPSSTTMECTQCLQLEKRLDESRNEVCQITVKLETLQYTIHQRNQQVAHLENENRAIQIQVGCSESQALHGVIVSCSLTFTCVYIGGCKWLQLHIIRTAP